MNNEAILPLGIHITEGDSKKNSRTVQGKILPFKS